MCNWEQQIKWLCSLAETRAAKGQFDTLASIFAQIEELLEYGRQHSK